MNEENWNQKNKRLLNLNFTKTNETKTIAGYFCSQATASTPDGFEITVFYTRDLIPENKSYDPLLKTWTDYHWNTNEERQCFILNIPWLP